MKKIEIEVVKPQKEPDRLTAMVIRKGNKKGIKIILKEGQRDVIKNNKELKKMD